MTSAKNGRMNMNKYTIQEPPEDAADFVLITSDYPEAQLKRRLRVLLDYATPKIRIEECGVDTIEALDERLADYQVLIRPMSRTHGEFFLRRWPDP